MVEEEAAKNRLLKAILEKATTDLDFRQWLLTDPLEAIRAEMGIEIPPGYKIGFIEKEPGLDALVVLPDLRPDAVERRAEKARESHRPSRTRPEPPPSDEPGNGGVGSRRHGKA